MPDYLLDYFLARHYFLTVAQVRALPEREKRLMLSFLAAEAMGDR